MTNLNPRWSALISPYGDAIADFVNAGQGLELQFTRSGPPQAGAVPFVTHPVGAQHGADCPTCDLVEIPYNPNLPVLRL